MDIQEAIEYFSVFDGFSQIEDIRQNESIFENIKKHILERYVFLKKDDLFWKDEHEYEYIVLLLQKLTSGDRKKHSIYKTDDISRYKGISLYKKLFEANIIKKESSREKPIVKNKKRPIKKELRQYTIEDKIKFTSGFKRFWYTFIAPNLRLLEEKKSDELLQTIKDGFEKYVSFTFEELSNDIIRRVFEFDIVETGSYWDKNIEIDLLAKTKDAKMIAGECKWKNQKICKNVLTKLQKKCQKANLQIDYFALFSKSGYSKELLNMKDKNVLLVDLDTFKGVYGDR